MTVVVICSGNTLYWVKLRLCEYRNVNDIVQQMNRSKGVRHLILVMDEPGGGRHSAVAIYYRGGRFLCLNSHGRDEPILEVPVTSIVAGYRVDPVFTGKARVTPDGHEFLPAPVSHVDWARIVGM